MKGDYAGLSGLHPVNNASVYLEVANVEDKSVDKTMHVGYPKLYETG